MKRYIPWVLAVVSLAAAVYFFVLLVDAGISLDSARARTSQLQERGGVSLELLKRGWIGESRANVLSVAEGLEKKGVIVKNYPEIIEIDGIVFNISGDKVIHVSYMD